MHHLQHLDRTRFAPHVVLSNEGWLTARLDELRVPWTLLPFGHWNFFSILGNRSLVGRLARYIAQHRIGLVHANEHWVAPPCLLAARKEGIPAVCHFRTGLDDLAPRRVRKYRYGEFDRVIVVAEVLRRALAAQVSDRSRILVVRDGVESMAARPSRRGASGRRILINVGALYDVKGQAKILDQALPWLQANRRRYLVFVGGVRKDPAYVAGMRRVVAAHGLARQVRFLGSREDVPRLFGIADALVAYSTVEGIPRVVMEAMLAGLPVIVSNSAGMDEVVTDGEVGRIVDFEAPGNVLASTLDDFSSNSENWREMGRRAAARAAARYSTRAMSDAIQALYNELLHADQKS